MTRFCILLSSIMLVAVSNVSAQDDAPPLSLAVSYFQCDYDDVPAWINQIDSLQLPIWQELVDEGAVSGFGTLVHAWAGYENVILWRSGASVASLIEAQGEAARRISERHPDAPAVGCGTHYDGLYTLGPNTGPTSEGFGTTMLSHYKCATGDLGGIASRADSVWIPIMKEFVDEGRLGSFGLLFHDWASEENVIMYASAKDVPSWLEVWQEWGERTSERFPDANVLGKCNAHRDGFYTVGPRTFGPTSE